MLALLAYMGVSVDEHYGVFYTVTGLIVNCQSWPRSI